MSSSVVHPDTALWYDSSEPTATTDGWSAASSGGWLWSKPTADADRASRNLTWSAATLQISEGGIMALRVIFRPRTTTW
jgi:hypothetical protein